MAAVAALGSAGVVLSTAPVADATATFSNPATITINDSANATPYPSGITVSGMAGTITAVTVTLTGFSHGAMADVGVVLVAPNGDAMAIMDGVGSSFTDVNNVDLTISDSAASLPSDTTNPATGTYKPASYDGTTDVFPAPGPGGAYAHPAPDGAATLSSIFGGDAPNGTWNLFVRDFFVGDIGSISGGWSISITTTEHLQDGGFEATVSGDSPGWTEADSVFGTPLCDAVCGGAGPHAGTWWAWFGGTNQAGTASLTQSVTIPAGGAALSFYLYRSDVPPPLTATLTVKMDATVLHVFPSVVDSGYTLRTFDVSAFAGGTHTLSFNYSNPDTRPLNNSPNFHVDDVSLTSGAPVTTGTPTVTTTTPVSPSKVSTTPLVAGTAEAGTRVTLYSNSSCTSAALGSGPANLFAGGGIPATVPANTATTIFAQATKSGQVDSACSSTSVSYTHDSIAPAQVTLSSVTPASPNPSTTPTIVGTAEAGSTVALYTTSDCTGPPAAIGTAAEFDTPGLTATVAVGSTTTFEANATDAAGNTSACSASSLTYVQQNPATPPPPTAPDTALTQTPKKKVTTTKSKAKVSFSFSSATAGATFQCSIDGQAFTACTSGQTFKLKVGKHTFAVRALDAGQTDPTPATYGFKVKRKG